MRWMGIGWFLAASLASCADPVASTSDNAQPFAHPGTGSTYLVGTRVTLDGSASWDPDGDSLSFEWAVTRCPAACTSSLTDSDAAVALLDLQAVGDYEVTLSVSDGRRRNTATIHIRSQSTRIELDAGPDQTVEWRIPVELSASVVIEESRPAAITWELVERPTDSTALATSTGETTASFVPDRAGRYVARVTVETADVSEIDELVVLAHAQRQVLGYRPLKMEYSTALDRIVATSNLPAELHVLDPFTGTETAVSLPAPPVSLSIEPTGLRAAVGHTNSVTIIDLEPLAVAATLDVPTSFILDDVHCVFGAGDVAHCFSHSGHVEEIRSIDLSSGLVTEGERIMPRSTGRLHPSTSVIYTSDALGFRRYDVSTLPVSIEHEVSLRCEGKPWFSTDGAVLFNRCGDVLQVSDDPALDLVPIADLTPFGVSWIVESPASGRIATIGGRFVEYFDRQTFTSLEVAPIPDTLVNGAFHESTGRFAAYSADGSQLFVIVDADVSYAVLSVDP